MILTSDLIKKIGFLVETPEDLLPLFSPMEKAVIVALKQMAKNKAACDAVPNFPEGSISSPKCTEVEVISPSNLKR